MQDDVTGVGADEWLGRTGESWAAEWRRTDRSFGMLTERLLQRGRAFTFETVLDVGCGAGELALAIARGRPHCRVRGIDISPQLVAVARERGVNHQHLSFEVEDAALWRPDGSFVPELVISRHGVMFFDRPVAAFAHLREVAAPDAGLLFSCFRGWDENPVFTQVAALLPEPPPPPDPDVPGPFAFSGREKVQAILEQAGWTGIALEPFDFAMILGTGEDPIEDTVSYFASIGVAARAARELDEAARAAFFDRVRELAARNLREGIVTMRAAAWIVTARGG